MDHNMGVVDGRCNLDVTLTVRVQAGRSGSPQASRGRRISGKHGQRGVLRVYGGFHGTQ
jgi:hypothetical protein